MAILQALLFALVCGLIAWLVMTIVGLRSKADAVAGVVTVIVFLVQVI